MTAASLQDQQKFLLLLNCDKENCDCSYFVAKINASRDCSNCGHSWFFHAVDKIRKSKNCEIRLDVVFSIASLILYATSAVPVNLKILLDRLLSKLLHSEVLQVIYALGWLYEDYVRGYKFFNQSLSQLDSWKTVTLQEEIEIIQLFTNFAETNSIAVKILDHLKASQGSILSPHVPQTYPTFNPLLSNIHEGSFDKLSFLAATQAHVFPRTQGQILAGNPVAQEVPSPLEPKMTQEAPIKTPKKYKCLLCLKTFHSINVLKLHRRSAHSHKVANPKTEKTVKSGVTKKKVSVSDTKPRILSSSPSDFSQTSPPPHEQDCKCKKCKFLFTNPKLSVAESTKEIKPQNTSIFSPASLSNSFSAFQHSQTSFSSPASFDLKAAKYCNFIPGTDAIQEIRSLEALVSSVQFDKFESGSDPASNKEMERSKVESQIPDESIIHNLQLKSENISCDTTSSAESIPATIISSVAAQKIDSETLGIASDQGISRSSNHQKDLFSTKTLPPQNLAHTAKTSVIRPRMSTIKSDSQHEIFSRKKDKQPVNKLTILTDVNKPRTENLSWSELKNCSLTVREKLNALVENRNHLLVNSKSESGVKLSSEDSSTAAHMTSVRSLLSCKCPKCGKIFSSPASMRVHFKNVHIREMHKCLIPGCNSLFNSVRSRNRHSMNANLHQRKSAHIHFL